MAKKNILIRCDASKKIGLGHITRCLALANEFRNDGHKVFFAIKNHEIAIQKLKEQKFDILIADDKDFDYFKWIENILEKKDIDVFIGDIRDGFPSELIILMNSKNILTIAIDEPSEYAKKCKLCFYPPHALIDKDLYKGKIYQGLEYIILREEFYKKQNKKKNTIPNILVMMGGTDAFNLTLPIVKQIDKENEKFKISVRLSKSHKDIDLLNKYAKISKHKISVYNEVKNMAEFLNGVDFALVSFGTSIYEILTKNIPITSICLNEEHYNSSDYFVKNGYATRYKYNELEKIKINKEIKTISEIKKGYYEIIRRYCL